MNEVEALKPFQAQIAGMFGFLLQYLRGFSKFPEWAYHAIAVVLAGAFFVLFNHLDYPDWRTAVVMSLLGVSAALVSIYGGTFVASNGAKAGMPFMPVTNSVGSKPTTNGGN